MEFLRDDDSKVDQYIIEGRIGKGAFGEVCHGIDTYTGLKVAIKQVKSSSKSEGISKALFREINSLRQLQDCEYVISLVDVYAHDINVCLVFEYQESDLAEVIQNRTNHFQTSEIKTYTKMILAGLSYCHSKKIIHRDIKPSNFLLSSSGTVKLADFGLARLIDPYSKASLSHQVSTRMYRAPELLFASRSYDFSMDIWSVGAVVAELLLLHPLFPGLNDIDQIFRVFQIMGTPTKENWPDVDNLPDYSKLSFPEMKPLDFHYIIPMATNDDIQFLLKLLKLNPKARITANDAMVDNYFYTSPLPCLKSSLVIPTRNLDKSKSKKRMNGLQNHYKIDKIEDIRAIVDDLF